MLCESRDDVVEEGVNVWAGEETAQFKPKYDIFLLHGLGSHPYHAFLSPPVQRRSSRSILWTDSGLSFRPSSSDTSRTSSLSRDDAYSPPITPLDSPWANEYSETDPLGRIGTFWPKDLLPKDIRDARICTVGYRSQWTSPSFQPNLQECGESLLTALDHARATRQSKARPIVFIAHSYGGLVVLKALLSAKLKHQYASISRLVLGCIFLGTPFGGCEFAGHLSMALHIGGNKQEIVHSLRPGSQELEDLRIDFIREYGERPLVSFYERCKTDLIHSVMVPAEKTQLGDAKSIGLFKDHRELVKFSSSTDESYRMLIAELKIILRKAREKQERKPGRPNETRALHGGRPPPSRSASRQQLPMELDSTEVNEGPVWTPRNSFYGIAGHEERSIPSVTTVADRNSVSAAVTRFNPHLASLPGASPLWDPHKKIAHQPGSSSRVQRPPGNARENLGQQHAASNSDTTVRLPPHLRQSYNIMQAQPHVKKPPSSSDVSYNQISGPSSLVNDGLVDSLRFSASYDHPWDMHGSSRARGTDKISVKMPNLPSIQPTYAPSSVLPEILTIGTSGQKPAKKATHTYSPFEIPIREIYQIRHLGRADNALRSFHESSITDAYPETWKALVPDTSEILHANRMVITGALGTGKTSLAMACIKGLLSAPDVSIFWVTAESEATLAEQLGSVASLLRLDLKNNSDPWSCLSACLRHLSSGRCGRSVMVLDNLQCKPPATLDIVNLCPTGSDAYLLVTTARMSHAQRIADESNIISMATLKPVYSAGVLSHGAAVPDSPIYDQLAQRIENNPFVLYRVRDHLQSTGVSIIDYVASLEYILNDNNWAATGRLVNDDKNDRGFVVSAVLDSCLNPSWFCLFQHLAEQEPSSAELLSKLSMLGRRTIPLCLLTSNASDTAATNVLLDRFCLTRRENYLQASQLMFIAHRCWLLEHEGLAKPFKMALAMIANQYPDAANRTEIQSCWEWEPFADAVMSACALSWFGGDETCRFNCSMLAQKRDKLSRYSSRRTQNSR